MAAGGVSTRGVWVRLHESEECSTHSRQRNEWEPSCEVLIGRLLWQQSEARGRRQDPPPDIRSCLFVDGYGSRAEHRVPACGRRVACMGVQQQRHHGGGAAAARGQPASAAPAGSAAACMRAGEHVQGPAVRLRGPAPLHACMPARPGRHRPCTAAAMLAPCVQRDAVTGRRACSALQARRHGPACCLLTHGWQPAAQLASGEMLQGVAQPAL